MKTEIDPRPVTSFDDLIAITEADAEEFRREYPSNPSILRIMLAWMPLLIGLAIVVMAACVGVFLYLYQDAAIYGLLAIVTLMFGA